MQRIERRATPGKIPTWAASLGFTVVVYLVFIAFYAMFWSVGQPLPIKASPLQFTAVFFIVWGLAYGALCLLFWGEEV